jgi:hypothetical protein
VTHDLEAARHVLQLLGDVAADLAQPAAALAAAAGLTRRVLVRRAGLGPVDVGFARQVLGQAAVDGRTVGGSRRGCGSGHSNRLAGRQFIQWLPFQQGALGALGTVCEALGAAAEHHPVTPDQLQLELGRQQLEHLDLGIALLQPKTQRCGVFGLLC